MARQTPLKNDVTANLPTAPDDEPVVNSSVPMWDYYAASCLAGYIQRGDNIVDAAEAAALAADAMMKARLERAKQRANKATYAMETGEPAYNQDLTKE